MSKDFCLTCGDKIMWCGIQCYHVRGDTPHDHRPNPDFTELQDKRTHATITTAWECPHCHLIHAPEIQACRCKVTAKQGEPTNEIVDGLNYDYLNKGHKDICSQCKKGIHWGGEYWYHSDGIKYRHACRPIFVKKKRFINPMTMDEESKPEQDKAVESLAHFAKKSLTSKINNLHGHLVKRLHQTYPDELENKIMSLELIKIIKENLL